MNNLRHSRSLAYSLGHILDAIYTDDPLRFPVNVVSLALEYSAQRFPNDPIVFVRGDDLPDFDGALIRTPQKKDWGIIYSNSVGSKGRIRFTLAHELGHYLLHRTAFPQGLPCTQWDSLSSRQVEHARIERESDEFASHLLMPINDFCKQIKPREMPTFNQLSGCADRYGVSLTAAVLHWVNYTKLRAVVVVSREGFILWARSSRSAMNTRTFFKTVNAPPIPLHEKSLPVQALWSLSNPIAHDPGIWFDESCEEIAMFSHQHDFAISVLFLDTDMATYELEEEPFEDAYDYITRRVQGSSCCL